MTQEERLDILAQVAGIAKLMGSDYRELATLHDLTKKK